MTGETRMYNLSEEETDRGCTGADCTSSGRVFQQEARPSCR